MRLENGDAACYVVLAIDGKETTFPGDFDLCKGGKHDATALVGKVVVGTREKGNVLAASCQGDPDCKKSDVVDVVMTLATPPFIGGLDLGTSAASVVAQLGKPASKTTPEVMAATGEIVSTWTWPDRGVTLTMGGTAGNETVSIIEVKAPSPLKTAKGIGIGATRAEFEAAYGKHEGEPSVNLGDAYDPTVFTFKDGKVVEIARGGGAE